MKEFGKLKSWERQEQQVVFRFAEAEGVIKILSPSVFRVYSCLETKNFPSVAVEVEKCEKTKWSLRQEHEVVIITTEKAIVKIYDDFKVDFYTLDGRVLCRDYRRKRMPIMRVSESQRKLLLAEGHYVRRAEMPDTVTVAKIMEGTEAFYGLGDKTGFLNKRGYEYDMWNTDDPKPHVDTYKALYKTIPFCIVSREDAVFGLFFDNSCRSHFDFGKESDNYYFYTAKGGDLNYYFFFADDMPSVLEEYMRLTGTAPLPQKWALGYHQSRWGYSSTDEITAIVEKMRACRIPCDAIHMDIDYMEKYKVFTFDRERFADMQKFSACMEKKGIKLVAIVDPGVKKEEGYGVYDEGLSKGYYVKTPEGEVYSNHVWPGESVFPDFGRSEVRDWWAEKQNILLNAGIRGIWNDMNEPATFKGEIPSNTIFSYEDTFSDHVHVHNVYGHYMCRATYEGLKEYDGRRPFVLTRACYAGTQKYALAWTGDNTSMWAHLQMAIPQLCNLGLSGMPFVGTDIGGFGGDTTKELLIRWVQLGAFTPFMRNHSTMGTRPQEPWQFDAETLNIYSQAVEMRYHILPYLYDLFYEEERTGLPLMRPLVLHYEKDETARECNGEFLLGQNLLIAPVVEQGARVKAVYLPAGEWFDYDTGEKFEGGRWILRDAPLDVCPVYVKAGTILPVWENMQFVGEKDTDGTLRLEVFPGDGEWNHLQDNGEDFAYRNGEYNLYHLRQCNNKLHIECIHNGYFQRYKKVIICYRGKEFEKAFIDVCEIDLEKQ